MPGPLPKSAKTRQRRNKSSTRAVMVTDDAPVVAAPELPAKPGGPWQAMTKTWWADVWSSPLHQQYLRADFGSLFRLAAVVDKFWATEDLEYAKEIRLLEREFGLTPLSRRRLEWTIVQTEVAVEKVDRKRSKGGRVIEHDPREVLTQ